MSFNSSNKASRSLTVQCAFNVLPMIDHLTGQWVDGFNGEKILVGGFAHHTGILAVANAGKSALGLHLFCSVANRYKATTGHIYETEGTMPISRVTECSKSLHDGESFDMAQLQEDDDPRFMMVDGTQLLLGEWADKMREESNIRYKQRGVKKYQVSLPFNLSVDRGNKLVAPMIVFIDSASEASPNSAQMLVEAGTDDSKAQTYFMRDGLVKTRVYGTDMIKLNSKGDIWVISTGSIDNFLSMDSMPGQAPEKTMGHLSNKKRMKSLGTSYKKRTSNCWQFGQPKALHKGTARADKYPKYPLDSDDIYPGNNDLEYVAIQNIRGKSGGSGAVFELVRSQRDGVLPTITELNFLKTWGHKEIKEYGIHEPKNHTFALDLLPDVHFRFTTVRGISNSCPELRRAMELTFGMKMEFFAKQSKEFQKYRCTPEELYNDIKDLGYDWAILLKTRGYWQFKEEEDPDLPYLSILDLLRMRTLEYKPAWYSQPLKGK